MKKIIVTKSQASFLMENDSVNVAVQSKDNTLAGFTNAATSPNTISDMNKATAVANDANMIVNGPETNDSQPQQSINVGVGETVASAIATQGNDELVRNGGSLKISGDGLGEAKIYTKKIIEEARLNGMRKNGRIMTKMELINSFMKK